MAAKSIEADVRVVGGGLAGLTAARRLPQPGRAVALHQARHPAGGGGVDLSAAAGSFLDTTVRAMFACDLCEVSLLNLLFLIRSAGGLGPLMTVEGGYQQDQFVGGAQSLAGAMAADLGDSLVLGAPVRAITERDSVVTVTGAAATVTAQGVIVAVPPALASHIEFDPPLPADHALLLHQLPAGTEVKAVAVYEEPFWRSDGLSGASLDMDAP